MTAGRRYEAENVVVATGAEQVPKVPPFADELDPSIVQLHSRDYRRTSQLREGGVLLVGAGNSGADIAMDVIRDHPTWLSGRDTGRVPVRIERLPGKMAFPVVRFLFHHVLTTRNPDRPAEGPGDAHQGRPTGPCQDEGPPGGRRGARAARDGRP